MLEEAVARVCPRLQGLLTWRNSAQGCQQGRETGEDTWSLKMRSTTSSIPTLNPWQTRICRSWRRLAVNRRRKWTIQRMNRDWHWIVCSRLLGQWRSCKGWLKHRIPIWFGLSKLIMASMLPFKHIKPSAPPWRNNSSNIPLQYCSKLLRN